MMVLQALRDGFEVRAAATVGTFTDLDAYLKEDPQAAAVSSKILPGFEQNVDAHVERRSAIRWADRISAPLLIMHGGSDTSVSPSLGWWARTKALPSRALCPLCPPWLMVSERSASSVVEELRGLRGLRGC
jgi:alpha-beta hydrolase superfamily lysophospholipase